MASQATELATCRKRRRPGSGPLSIAIFAACLGGAKGFSGGLATHQSLSQSCFRRAARRNSVPMHRRGSEFCVATRLSDERTLSTGALLAAYDDVSDAPAEGEEKPLELLGRKELQALAKAHGIKANGKNSDIIAGLHAAGIVTAASSGLPDVDATAASVGNTGMQVEEALAAEPELFLSPEAEAEGEIGEGEEFDDVIYQDDQDQDGEDAEDAAAASIPWTEDRCTRRLSVLQRKLRQVQSLAGVPQSELDEQQQAKLDRREALMQEIFDMEKLRRLIRKDAATGDVAAAAAGVQSSSVGDSSSGGSRSGGLGDDELLQSPWKSGMASGGGMDEEDLADAALLEAEQEKQQKEADLESPAQLPKRLVTALTYCRLSARDTCEALILMGRVSVNGTVIEVPSTKVDLLYDVIVANGVRVTLPPKIDNAALAADKMAEFEDLQQRARGGYGRGRAAAAAPAAGRRGGGEYSERRPAGDFDRRGGGGGSDRFGEGRERRSGPPSRRPEGAGARPGRRFDRDGGGGGGRGGSYGGGERSSYGKRDGATGSGEWRRSDGGGGGRGRDGERSAGGWARRESGGSSEDGRPRRRDGPREGGGGGGGGSGRGRGGGGSGRGRDDGPPRREPRVNDGRRDASGNPLPKDERSTWKSASRYSWKVDGGLLARKTRGIRPRDGNFIDRERRED